MLVNSVFSEFRYTSLLKLMGRLFLSGLSINVDHDGGESGNLRI